MFGTKVEKCLCLSRDAVALFPVFFQAGDKFLPVVFLHSYGVVSMLPVVNAGFGIVYHFAKTGCHEVEPAVVHERERRM